MLTNCQTSENLSPFIDKFLGLPISHVTSLRLKLTSNSRFFQQISMTNGNDDWPILYSLLSILRLKLLTQPRTTSEFPLKFKEKVTIVECVNTDLDMQSAERRHSSCGCCQCKPNVKMLDRPGFLGLNEVQSFLK